MKGLSDLFNTLNVKMGPRGKINTPPINRRSNAYHECVDLGLIVVVLEAIAGQRFNL